MFLLHVTYMIYVKCTTSVLTEFGQLLTFYCLISSQSMVQLTTQFVSQYLICSAGL